MIFNKDKQDYKDTPVFLGEAPGLVDSINRRHPEIWKIFKGLKSDDWDENEFNFVSCNTEFKTADRNTYDMMIKSLAWQWETDSVAGNAILPIIASFNPCTEVWVAAVRIADNELVHALTYSEIVRVSFDDPNVIMEEILSVNESVVRLSSVGDALDKIKRKGLEFQLGLIPNDQSLYNEAYKLPIIMLYLERIQFMASFGVTFAIAEAGNFIPIGKAVQRIAKDELESHVPYDQSLTSKTHLEERGAIARVETKDELESLMNDVIVQECKWVDYLFSEGRSLVGLTAEKLKLWVGFNSLFVANRLGYVISTATYSELECVEADLLTNPLPWITDWLDMSKIQPSPQEEDNGQYKVNILVRDDDGLDIDTSDLF